MPINQPNTNTALIDQNKKNQQKGTGFTNINRILDANKGAGQRMGSQIGNQLTQQADSVRAGIQQSQNQFNQQKQQAGQQAQGAVKAGQNLVKQAGETDDAYAQRVANANQNFQEVGQNLQGAQYTGPMGLQNAGKLQAQASTTASLGQLAGNTGGQTQLLQSMVAKPGQYNRGQSALDALLLGSGGQQAIQQGRRAAVGLQDTAMGATERAENQANALKAGINQSRDKALTDLRNAVVGEGGFRDQAAKQAQTFQKDASDLSALLNGTMDVSTPEGKQRAQELLDRMGEFGLDNYNLYNKDENATRAALGQLGSTLSHDFGSRKYTDEQKKASQNLAALLGDTQLQDELNKAKFNTDVFGNEADIFKGMDERRAFDTETKNILSGLAGDISGLKQNFAAKNQAKLDAYSKQLDGMNLPPQAKAALIQDMTNKMNQQNIYLNDQTAIAPMNYSGFGNTPGEYSGGQYNPYAGSAYQYLTGTEQERQALDKQLGQLTPEFFGAGTLDYDTKQGAEAVGDKYSDANKYGFLAFGDRGDQDIAERFRGLGLNAEAGSQPGQYRNEQKVREAANKALGPDAQLRDFVLNKILGMQTGGRESDLNSGGGRTLTQK